MTTTAFPFLNTISSALCFFAVDIHLSLLLMLVVIWNCNRNKNIPRNNIHYMYYFPFILETYMLFIVDDPAAVWSNTGTYWFVFMWCKMGFLGRVGWGLFILQFPLPPNVNLSGGTIVLFLTWVNFAFCKKTYGPLDIWLVLSSSKVFSFLVRTLKSGIFSSQESNWIPDVQLWLYGLGLHFSLFPSLQYFLFWVMPSRVYILNCLPKHLTRFLLPC